MRATTRTLLLCLCVVFTCGCASLPPGTTRSARDPWERMNRGTYKFNDGLDRAVLKPVAKGYARFVPQFVQTGVHNFFTNLTYPKVMINDLLQGQLDAFGNDVGRFVANTTLGIGGLFDPATPMGLDKQRPRLRPDVRKVGPQERALPGAAAVRSLRCAGQRRPGAGVLRRPALLRAATAA